MMVDVVSGFDAGIRLGEKVQQDMIAMRLTGLMQNVAPKLSLDEVREKFPDRYVDNYVMLSRVIRLEADVKHSLAKPKTVDEALAELESKVGKDGRRKFEKFLREVGELDDEDDVIDVESKKVQAD
jgi:hypothetical protein